ncbi:hypothetical protein ACFY19_00780 [Streptosporangium saharense]|uniref:hypothetical protein n=1 Tax=Streptosporangium saharense TaxID=1706840 RepID=UPI003678C000
MTLVNWERLPGETVEEFVAAMLLLRHPHGNRITPSRGDRGVDIRVANSDGYDVYQVKRFCRPLTSRQVTNVEESWRRFVNETLPTLPVRSWTLVTPWNPTHERLEWLERLTTGSGLRIGWMDRDRLDGMAADHPALIAYYFGDGGERISRLMTQALQGGRDMPNPAHTPTENLLVAAIERYESLAAALTDIDPFYRYAFEVREGRMTEQPWDADAYREDLTAFVRYLQLNERYYLVMRLMARAVESFRLRPITGSFSLQVPVDSAEQQAVEEFLQYGAPFADIDGVITHTSGPPGLPSESGPGQLSFIVHAGVAGDRPDLEIRLIAADGAVLHTLDLVGVRASRGVDGPGIWLAGHDPSGLLQLHFLVNADDHDIFRLHVDLDDLAGKTPVDVLPAMRLLTDFVPDNTVLLAVRGGPAYAPRWQPEKSELVVHARRQVRILEALQIIQTHSYQRIVIPEQDHTSNEELRQLAHLARLLRGSQLEATWTYADFLIPTNASPPAEDEFPVAIMHKLHAQVGGRQIPLDMYRCVTYLAARIADPAEAAASQGGDSIRLLPGSNNKAIITAVSAAEAIAAFTARDSVSPND